MSEYSKSMPPRTASELVGLIHCVNHAWKRAQGDSGVRELSDLLRRRKDLLQLELLEDHPERCALRADPENPGTFAIALVPPVDGWKDAAHIPIDIVPDAMRARSPSK